MKSETPRASGPVSAESQFEAAVDAPRNVVRMHFAGAFTPATMRTAAEKLAALLPQLKSGFTMLADFGHLTRMELDCVPHLTRIMDLCRERQAGLIVRILPERHHDIGINLLGVLHYRGKVRTVTVSTLPEAEALLR